MEGGAKTPMRNFSLMALLIAMALLFPFDTALFAFDPALEDDTASEAGRFLSLLKETRPEPVFPRRNLFEEWLGEEAIDPRFTLIRIERMDPPLIYQGVMEEGEGLLTAQVNFEGKSHFIKEGSELKGWKILSLTKEKIEARSPEGEAIAFPFRMRVPGRVKFALILKEPEGVSYRVSEGEEIEGHEVAEIGEKIVKLRKGEEIISLVPTPESNPGVGKKVPERRSKE